MMHRGERGEPGGRVTRAIARNWIVASSVLLVACGSAQGSPGDSGGGDAVGDGARAPAIVGTVTDLAMQPVGGGVVELRAGGTIVETAAVDAAGRYEVADLPPGVYTLRLQPPLAYSVGPSEPLDRSATVVAGAAAPVDASFVVQPAMYADDFQSYTDVTQITGGCNGVPAQGTFFHGVNHDMNCANTENMSLDRAGGPSGSAALRYDWPARPTGTDNYTISLQPRFNPLPPVGSQFWVRFTDKLSTGFRVGGAGATGASMEYKYMFLDTAPAGRSLGSFQFELESVTTQPSDQLSTRTKIIDTLNHDFTSDRFAVPPGPGDSALDPASLGQWTTWVLGITGIGSASVTFDLYRDGVLVQSISGAWFPGEPLGGPGSILTVELGANINNGPDATQSRWWREFGVYFTRPSLRPLVM